LARAAPRSGEASARFEDLYRGCYQDLMGFALRRTERPETAADVVADTFVVAWRRIDEIPPNRARPWLFGVARNVLSGHERSHRRQERLAARLRQVVTEVTVAAPRIPDAVSSAFRSLSDGDREVLQLVAWENLSAEDLAVALDCTVNAARIRLHRARRRFAVALDEQRLNNRGVAR
jgi:RNA polymerase sigma-70 factor (ECF subfamily)